LSNQTQQPIVLSYTYDDHFFTGATDPRGNQPVITHYDPVTGRMDYVIDAVGAKTEYSYDLPTRTTTITYLGKQNDSSDDLGFATLVYDEAGYLTNYTDTLGHETIYGYDPANHNLTSISDMVDSQPRTTQYTYNADGHPTTIIDPLGKTLGTVAYNQYGGPCAATIQAATPRSVDPVTFMPESAVDVRLSSYTWLPQDKGNPTTFTNQYGQTTNYFYTAQGYLEREEDPLGHKTFYTYNDFGQVKDMTVAYQSLTTEPSTTHYDYDELGRLTDVTVAVGTDKEATTHYDYDQNGNRTDVTVAYTPPGEPVLPERSTTHYVYDSANRLTDVVYAADTPLESTTHYDYDFYSRLTDVIVALGTEDESITHYTYYNNGLKKDVTIADGTANASTTHYEYYADGRVKDVTVAYTPPGAPTLVETSTTHYVYDDAGRMTLMTIAVGTPDASTMHYTYYDSGLTKSVTTAYGTLLAATTTYFYDSRGRLKTTQYPDGTTTTGMR
jgi:YD repeat-containing protein